MKKNLLILVSFVLVCAAPFSSLAYAQDLQQQDTSAVQAVDEVNAKTSLPPTDTVNYDVSASAEGSAAYIEGATFALDSFNKALKGGHRQDRDKYLGYSYFQGATADFCAAVVTREYVLVYVPVFAHGLFGVNDVQNCEELRACIAALDNLGLSGGDKIKLDVPWYFIDEPSIVIDDIKYSFNVEIQNGSFYTVVTGINGEDIISEDPLFTKRPVSVDVFKIVAPEAANIVAAATGFDAFLKFLSGIDMSPLWVTLKTTGTAIVFIFVLGLAAAYFTMRISKRAQDIFDTIFTIPMVLPPTVCGFLLLLLLGKNTAFGQWFIDIGFPLIFSWPATVIAATIVAFPLMYRSSRGAFENLDPNMMDAARTLGWSNAKIFFKLMVPLSWSSIAAATVLAFARALGEFGATLFLAGNYVGITRTIPIAIYFEWMSGNTDVAIFWTVVILFFSFLVILFINLWSRRTTKYRRGVDEA